MKTVFFCVKYKLPRTGLLIIYLFLFTGISGFSQTHSSVPLESRIYYLLEQAQIKGLCSPLSGIRPYSQNVIITALNEILDSNNVQRLSALEREILYEYLDKYAKPQSGINLNRGMYHAQTYFGDNTPLTFNAGTNIDLEVSGGLYQPFSNRYSGTEIWVRFFMNGDIGRNFSWELAGEGGLMKAPRRYLGEYNTYYEGFINVPGSEYQNDLISVYGEPLTHFPYTYRKRWDGSVYFFSELSEFESWPVSTAGGYNIISEVSASFLENKLFMRMGRLSREWSSTPFGSSLVLNQMARPFLGMEAEFRPFSWFGIASMTGFLEYNNIHGIKTSAMTFQNAYSITMVQFKYKNYFFLDVGEAVVWPKRFELGYIFPLVSSFFYQNNVGDFDNLALFLNLKAQYPGIGNVWFSLFLDEISLVSNWHELDRSMLAWQAGTNISLPFLSFSSIRLSYTRVNPYCYTHNRNFSPWYGDTSMETSYTNNGVSLGHYIPPNSDELLVRVKTMPARNLTTYFQYQLIRHGADFGPSAVDGSNLLSELDPEGRDGSNPVLKRFFLKDGAYQWMNILRVGAEWKLASAPVAFYGEAGVNYSFFTNTEEPANSGTANQYSRINTSDYPRSTGFIVKLGIRIFPR